MNEQTNEPTLLRTTRDGKGVPIETVTEFEDKHSIELGQTSKGAWYIRSLKLYGNDAVELASQAADMAATAMEHLKATGLPTEGG